MKKIFSMLVCLYLVTFSISFADDTRNVRWDLFVKFENMLKWSEVICVGTVLESSIDGDITKTSLHIDNIIKSDIENLDTIITVETDAFPKHYIAQSFNIGSQTMVLLRKVGNKYKLYSDPYCNFEIANGRLKECNVSTEAFIDEIKQVLNNDKQFSLQFPSYYKNAKYNKGNTVSKITDDGLHSISGYEFAAIESNCITTQLAIQFEINPANAESLLNHSIPFNTLKEYVQDACDEWNSIDDTGVIFTVSQDSTSRGYDDDDGHSVICFLTNGQEISHCAFTFHPDGSTPFEADIVFDGNYLWYMEGQTQPPNSAPLLKTLVHEMGHIVGLEDLGRDTNYSDYSYNDNIMWHTDDGMDWTLNEPQPGDEAGAVYMVPKPSGTTTANEIWSGFTGSANPLYITSDVTIASGDTVTIEEDDHIWFDIGAGINVYGRLIIEPNVTLNKSNISDWDGIDIKNGGTLELEGTLNIHNAYEALHFESGSTLTKSDATRINIYDSDSYAVRITNFSPSIKNIYINGGGKGIYVEGSSSDPHIERITVTNTDDPELYIATYGDSEMDDCILENINNDDTIYVGSYGDLNLHYGHNNIVPYSGKKAIDNQTTEDIAARYNWWGVANPPTSLFYDYTNVDYQNPAASAYDTTSAGAYKSVISSDEDMIAELDKLKEALYLEKTKNWNGALDIYKDVIASTINPQNKKRAIKDIFRVIEQSDKNFSDLKNILDSEIKTATGHYKAIYSFLLCEIKLREGKIGEAIEAFIANAEQYKGTSMEVEMLARIANIYGDYLDDKKTAKEYADKAAMLNPGQDILRSAYHSADIRYDPSLYTDIFKGVKENFDTIQLEDELSEEVSISVSPNPFNPSTTISYSLVEEGHVTLAVYNLAGQKVATLVDSSMPAGTHHAMFDGSNLASGMYFYRFETENVASNGKMMIVK